MKLGTGLKPYGLTHHFGVRRNRLPNQAEWRTPRERDSDGELARNDLWQVRRSAENLKSLGLM